MIVAKPRSREKIRRIADIVRAVSKDICFPVVHFLEYVMPQIYDGFYLEIVEDSELPDCLAKTIPKEKRILVREDVYNGAIAGNGRDRFTLAHEIGHYFLHQDIEVAYHRRLENLVTYKDPEWQANVFAAELLMPRDAIRNMSIDEISRVCKVSYKAAQIQKSYAN